MQRKLRTRFGSILLTIAMLLSLFPATAWATGEDLTISGQTYTAVPNNRISTALVNGVTASQSDGLVKYLVESKEDTSEWDQSSGEGSVDAYTYVGLYIDIPYGAAYLKYTDEGDPDNMTTVEAGSAFLQGGEFQNWFPVAEKKSGGSYSLFYGGRTYQMLLNWYSSSDELVKQEYVTVTRDLSDSLAVAQVSGYTYETLADAVAAAKSGETVELLKTSEGSGIKIDTSKKSLVFDLKGNTYTVTNPTVGSTGTETNAFQLLKGGSITFKNGTLKAGSSAKILIQNYCDLTLENVTVDCRGSSQCQYASSNNHGNIIMKGNTNIYAADGEQAFDVWYNLNGSYSDGVSVTIDKSMTGEINGIIEYGADTVTGEESSWTQKATLIIEGGNFTGSFVQSSSNFNGQTPNIVITGGTFSSDVSQYVAPNYECVKDGDTGIFTVKKLEDKLVVEGSVGTDGNVSGSLTGEVGSSGAAVGDKTGDKITGENTAGISKDVTISLTTGTEGAAGTATTTTLTVPQTTAESLNKADKLTVKTDAADVSFDSTALSTIASGASSASNDVTITVEKTTPPVGNSNVKASYEVSVTAGSTNLLPNSTNNGTVTITVPVPDNADTSKLTAWYVQNGVFVDNLGGIVNGDGKSFTFSITHLSEIYITDGTITSNVVASYVDSNGQVHYDDSLADAIEKAPAGGTVKLENNVAVTAPTQEKTGAININKNITIDGQGKYTVSVANTGFSHGGDWGTAGNPSYIGKYHVLNITSGKVILKDLTVDGGWTLGESASTDGFNAARSGINIWGGNVELNNVTVNNCSTYAVTIGNGATVKVTDLVTSGSRNGVNVDQGASLTIGGSKTSIGEAASIVYENDSEAESNGALTVNDGTYQNVVVQVGGTTESPNTVVGTVELNGGTYNGTNGQGGIVYSVANAPQDIGTAKTALDNAVTVNGGKYPVASAGLVKELLDSNNHNTVDSNGQVVVDTSSGNVVASIGSVGYTTLHDAIKAAKTGENKTVTLLSDIKVTSWNMIWNMQGITLDGDNNTLTINAIESGENHDAVFHSKGDNTFKDLIIDLSGVTTSSAAQGSRAFSAAPGDTFSNVTIKGNKHISYGITVGGTTATDETLSIDNCKFENVGIGVYDSSDGGKNKVDDLDITNSTFTNCGIVGVIRVEDTTFTGNTVTNSNELSLAITDAGKATVTDNTFQDAGKIWFAGADLGKVTFTQNKVLGSTIVSTDQAKDGTNLNVSKNYWGGGAPGDKTTGTNFTGENVYYLRPAMQDEDLNTYVPSTPDTPSYGGSSEPSGDYIVSVDRVSGGKVTVNPGRADKGDEVTVTVKPNDGYELDELVVTDSKGNEIKLTAKSGTKFTFTMPSGTVDVKATFVKIDAGSVLDDFTDVNPDAWYAQAVEFVVEEGLMTGTSATTFAPDTSMSRAMIWTVLAAYNSYNTSGGNPWYAPGQQWAMVNGVSDGTAPNSSITREQLAVMLWRAAGSPETSESLSGYADASSVSDWAVEALAWAVDNGIISGMGGSTLAPQATATRAQVAVMLTRFVDYMEA